MNIQDEYDEAMRKLATISGDMETLQKENTRLLSKIEIEETIRKKAELFNRDLLADNTALTKRMERMEGAAAKLCHLNECELEGIESGVPTPKQWLDAFNEMAKIIGGEVIARQALSNKEQPDE